MSAPPCDAEALAPNWDFVDAYLEALEPRGTFTFQAIPEPTGSAARAMVLHGTIDEFREKLEHVNQRGAGIFVMVNAGDGLIHEGAKSCRTAANVQRVRAVFVDLDGSPIGPVLASALPPDWVVRTSADRWHAYWKVSDCALEQFAGAQAALARRFDGDVAVKDLPRVMRVPGFYHRKSTPFMSQLYLPSDFDSLQRQPQ